MSASLKLTRTPPTIIAQSAKSLLVALVSKLLTKNGTTIALIASKLIQVFYYNYELTRYSRCGKDFPDGNFVDLNDRPYCRPCANQVGNSSPKNGHNHGNNGNPGYIVSYFYYYKSDV